MPFNEFLQSCVKLREAYARLARKCHLLQGTFAYKFQLNVILSYSTHCHTTMRAARKTKNIIENPEVHFPYFLSENVGRCLGFRRRFRNFRTRGFNTLVLHDVTMHYTFLDKLSASAWSLSLWVKSSHKNYEK